MNPFMFLDNLLVKDAMKELTNCWRANPREHFKNSIVYLAFDEAHSLITKGVNSRNATSMLLFSHLQTVLQSLRELPLFTLSLSTTGQVTHFVFPKKHGNSTRIQKATLKLIPSFHALGWDQYAEPYSDGDINLTKVDSLAYQTSLDCLL